MKRLSNFVLLAGLTILICGTARADTWVEWVPEHAVVAPGESVLVQLKATFSDPVIGWGVDLTLDDPGSVELSDIAIGVSWDEVNTIDGDGLAGLLFPTGVSGEVLLATLTFTGVNEGATELLLSYDGEDEGFLLEAGLLDTNVTFSPGTITVIPEPLTGVLVCLFAVPLLMRRFDRNAPF